MKVGDYVRTKDGRIAKIKQIDTCCKVDGKEVIYVENNEDTYGIYGFMITKDSIIKSSSNIIDLIENLDQITYRINGDIFFGTVESELIFNEMTKGIWFNREFIELKDLDIVSIVTKEQFESMEYNLESKGD